MLTCKITLPSSPHPVIISKNLAFWALYLARQNEYCFSLNKYTNFFPILGCWLLPKKFTFCPSLGAGCPPVPLACTYACANLLYNVNFSTIYVETIHTVYEQNKQFGTTTTAGGKHHFGTLDVSEALELILYKWHIIKLTTSNQSLSPFRNHAMACSHHQTISGYLTRLDYVNPALQLTAVTEE